MPVHSGSERKKRSSGPTKAKNSSKSPLKKKRGGRKAGFAANFRKKKGLS